VHKKYSNAYMLVYLRDCDVNWLLAPIPDSDIPVHLKDVSHHTFFFFVYFLILS
jgi:hypothetical protein